MVWHQHCILIVMFLVQRVMFHMPIEMKFHVLQYKQHYCVAFNIFPINVFFFMSVCFHVCLYTTQLWAIVCSHTDESWANCVDETPIVNPDWCAIYQQQVEQA